MIGAVLRDKVSWVLSSVVGTGELPCNECMLQVVRLHVVRLHDWGACGLWQLLLAYTSMPRT